jgi:hypothetical protein
MKITIVRKYKKKDYTIGQLFIDGVLFCNTLEDPDRGLDNDKMTYDEMFKLKIPGNTAIPKGTYTITLDIQSPKFTGYKYYKEFCNGYLPRVIGFKKNVKGTPIYDGVLIHIAVKKTTGIEKVATVAWTEGCPLIGRNSVVGGLTEGKKYFELLYNEMKKRKNEGIILEIKD